MIIRVFVLTLLLAATVVQAGTIHVVVDASATMYGPLKDRKESMTTVVDLVTTLFVMLPTDPEIEIGVRSFGADLSMTSDDRCSDSRLVNPIAPLSGNPTIELLSELRPRGAAPLAEALRRAAEDLESSPAPRTLILITDGDDSCGEVFEIVIDELLAKLPDLEIHVIGLNLPITLQQRFDAVANFHPARDSASLVASMVQAIGDKVVLDTTELPVAITLRGSLVESGIDAAELRSTVMASAHPLTIEGGLLTGELSPGPYTLHLSSPKGEFDIGRILVRRDADSSFIFDLPEVGESNVTITTLNGRAGEPVDVEYRRVPPECWLTTVPRDSAAHTIGEKTILSTSEGALQTTTPARPSFYEVRIHCPLGPDHTVIAARAPFVAFPPEVWLDIPEGLGQMEIEKPIPGTRGEVEIAILDTIETWQFFQLLWNGPELAGDFVTFAPADSAPEAITEIYPVSFSSLLDMWAPKAECDYVLRYVSPSSGAVLSQMPIRVLEPEAILEALDIITIQGEVEVHWIGPDDPNDFITIVPPDTPDGEYEIWRNVTSGNPLAIEAPSTPGQYEIRYMSGHGNRVLDRIPLEVEGIEVQLWAPNTIQAGRRFDVKWAGPDLGGDLIVIAPLGSGPRRQLEFEFTAVGNPVNLPAPFRSGEYEIRYISGTDGSILGRKALNVTD